MTDRPKIAYAQVELHLSADPDFPARFGQKVKRAGGKYGDIRGDARLRVVTVPASESGLIDDIARANFSPVLTVVVRKLSAEGYSDARIDQAGGRAHDVVFKWNGEDKSGPLSAFVHAAFERRMAAIDWTPTLSRWKSEDEQAAARLREQRLREEIASLQQAISAEAVRIEQGANDIEPLKELARRYRETCMEAGIETEVVASAPGM